MQNDAAARLDAAFCGALKGPSRAAMKIWVAIRPARRFLPVLVAVNILMFSN
jgi:hypothetical protein